MLSIWSKIIQTGGTRVLLLAANFITLIITAKMLGAESRGYIVAVNSWVIFYATVCSLSLGQIAQHFLHTQKELKHLKEVYSSVFLLSIIGSGLGLVFMIVQRGILPASFGTLPILFLFIAFSALPFYVWEQNASLFLVAMDQLKTFNITLLVGKGFTLCLILLSVLSFSDRYTTIAAILASQAVGQILTAGSMYYFLWRRLRSPTQFNKRLTHQFLKAVFLQHPSTIGGLVIFQSSILFLNAFSSQESVGVYQLAVQLISLLVIIPSATSYTFYDGIAKSSPDIFWAKQRTVSLQVFGIVIVSSLGLYYFAPTIISIIAGNEFTNSATVLRSLLPIVLGMTAAQLLVSQWVSRGIFALNSWITIIAATVSVIVNYLLVSRLGINGAILSDLLSIVGVVFSAQLIFAVWCDHRSRRVVATLKA
jgi:O-antigen/teichoic acid export membrane protein